MGKRLRIVLAGAAIAAAALAFMQSNRGPWSSDPGVRLRSTTSANGASIEFTKDAGNALCWIRLRLASNASVSAAVIGDHPLTVNREDGWWRITDPVASNANAPNLLLWFAGGHIRLRGANLRLEEWELYRSDGPMDSSEKERNRQRWFIAFVVLFLLAATGAAAQILWPETIAMPRFTPENCVLQLIDTLEARRPEHTKRMRELVTLTLITHRVEDVIARPRDLGLIEQGRKQLAERLDVLIEFLEARRKRLG